MTKHINQITISGILINDPIFFDLKKKEGKLAAFSILVNSDEYRKQVFRVITDNSDLHKVIETLSKKDFVSTTGTAYPQTYKKDVYIEVSAENIIIN